MPDLFHEQLGKEFARSGMHRTHNASVPTIEVQVIPQHMAFFSSGERKMRWILRMSKVMMTERVDLFKQILTLGKIVTTYYKVLNNAMICPDGCNMCLHYLSLVRTFEQLTSAAMSVVRIL